MKPVMKQREGNSASAGIRSLLASLGTAAGSTARSISSSQNHGVSAAHKRCVQECVTPQALLGLNPLPQGVQAFYQQKPRVKVNPEALTSFRQEAVDKQLQQQNGGATPVDVLSVLLWSRQRAAQQLWPQAEAFQVLAHTKQPTPAHTIMAGASQPMLVPEQAAAQQTDEPPAASELSQRVAERPGGQSAVQQCHETSRAPQQDTPSPQPALSTSSGSSCSSEESASREVEELGGSKTPQQEGSPVSVLPRQSLGDATKESESGMAESEASLTSTSQASSPEQGASHGLSHPPQHTQAQVHAAGYLEMTREDDEDEEETAFMASFFSQAQDGAAWAQDLTDDNSEWGEEETEFMASLFQGSTGLEQGDSADGDALGVMPPATQAIKEPLTAEDADRPAADAAASAADALPSGQQRRCGVQGGGGPDAADMWALQLSTDPPAETPACSEHEKLRLTFRSCHSKEVYSFMRNHPSQQVPKDVQPGRAKDLLVRGTALLEACKYQEMFDVLEEGVRMDVPEEQGELKFWLYHNRGVAALMLKKFMQAIFHFTVAIELKGTSWRPLMSRCEAFEAIGDYPAAAKDLQAIQCMGGMVDEYYLEDLLSMRKQPIRNAVLGIETDFLGRPLYEQDCHKKWRQMCMQFHPDKVTAPEAKASAVMTQQILSGCKPGPAA